MMRPLILALVSLSLALPCLAKDPKPLVLPSAHAHNDYLHKRPLLDAIDHGFCSVEADIFLIEGKLLVAHERRAVKPERTLERLYLEPLRKQIAENGGRVYREGPTFWLLIDIKSDGPTTFVALNHVLSKYADILSVTGDKSEEKAVRIVVSGNRPRDLIYGEKVRYAGMDGRLSDLSAPDSTDLLPWISDNWYLNFKWNGVGEFPAPERKKLHDIVAKAHDRGRLVRFWATPELTSVWHELQAAKVDLINTDDLEGLRDFLTKEDK